MTSIAKTATLSAISNPDTSGWPVPFTPALYRVLTLSSLVATVSLMILATAETAITIIAASIPVLRTLIQTASYTPHFYHYYQSEGTQPSNANSDRGLIASPSPVITHPRKNSLFGAQLASPLSNPESGPNSPATIWPEATASSWLNSGSESGVELPNREDVGGRKKGFSKSGHPRI